MNRVFSHLKFISLTFVSVFIFIGPIHSAFAKAGCCSGHKGVAGCDTKTGYLTCKDKSSAGPNCPCPQTSKTTGCCSGHGGVDKCDSKSKHQRCKDGTVSQTCTC